MDGSSELVLNVEGHYPGEKFGGYQITFDQPYVETTVNVASLRLADASDPKNLIVDFADFSTGGQLSIAFDPDAASGLHPPLQKRNAIELYYVVQGEVEGLLEKEAFTLHSGDALVVNSNTRNAYYYSPNTITVFFTMSKYFFERYFPTANGRAQYPGPFRDLILSDLSGKEYRDQDFLFCTCRSRNGDPPKPEVLLMQIFHELQTKEAGYDYMAGILTMRLFQAFCDESSYLCRSGKYVSLSGQELAQSIKKHLDRNKRKIGLEELSGIFHYDKRYISRTFYREFQCTLKQYNHDVVMKEALYLLQNSSDSVEQIARHVGFQGRGQFYKVFEAYYGASPSSLREAGRK